MTILPLARLYAISMPISAISAARLSAEKSRYAALEWTAESGRMPLCIERSSAPNESSCVRLPITVGPV